MAKKVTNEILKEIAEEILQSNLSPLMTDREKLATTDIIGEELTITECDIVDYNDNHYCILLFSEYEGYFYAGGLVLTKMIDGIIKSYDGDIEQVNNELKRAGLKIKLDSTKTKDKKKTVTTVTLL